jgi:formylglycine-generating enzyme required for sulfatase activity
MPELRPLKIFLCHASEDKPRVRELHRRLTADGAEVWLDEVSLLPGQNWRSEIPKAVRIADAVIVCLSPLAVDKEGYVQKEIRFALDAAYEKPEDTIYIIPAKLEDCRVTSRLSQWQWVNLFEGDEGAYVRLLASLKIRAQKVGASLIPRNATAPLSTEDVEMTAPTAQKRLGVTSGLLSNPEFVASDATPAGVPVFNFAGLEFVRVPRGRFLMGSKRDDPEAYDDEKPQHEVNLAYDYFIGRYPVTNEQFGQFVGATNLVTSAEKEGGWVWNKEQTKWVQIKDANWQHPFGGKSDLQGKMHHPVVQVSWFEALEFVKWLNRTSRSILSSGLAFRLPSEAEWEKAARGIEARKYSWGNRLPLPELGMDVCNICDTGIDDTTPVGKYSPDGDSPFGCADMTGNVFEWTRSLWRKGIEKAAFVYPYNPEDGRENLTAPKEIRRVVRGGSFYDDARGARCATRGHYDPYFSDVGFRVAVSPVSFL